MVSMQEILFFELRNLERDYTRGNKDSETRHHVSGGLPAGSSGHEETET